MRIALQTPPSACTWLIVCSSDRLSGLMIERSSLVWCHYCCELWRRWNAVKSNLLRNLSSIAWLTFASRTWIGIVRRYRYCSQILFNRYRSWTMGIGNLLLFDVIHMLAQFPKSKDEIQKKCICPYSSPFNYVFDIYSSSLKRLAEHNRQQYRSHGILHVFFVAIYSLRQSLLFSIFTRFKCHTIYW